MKTDMVAYSGPSLPLNFVALNSFILCIEGKSKADPEQTELAQYGKHLTGAGIKASHYLLALCSITISALLGQVQVVLGELAHFLHSAASAELSRALFPPRF